jgi:serine/threonine protein kinase
MRSCLALPRARAGAARGTGGTWGTDSQRRNGKTETFGSTPPFDQFRGIHRLAADRSGHASAEHARHQLYVARDPRSRTDVLIKVPSKPGLVYEQDLANEIATLSTINQELPDSRSFPLLREHGRLKDSRVFLIMSFFEEWPLARTIGPERIPARLVTQLRTTMEIARALNELHGLQIWHVDLNPMNILYRWERDKPVVRLVDFESSYEVARHSTGVFYNPPTTTGFTAPEVSRAAPDRRSDVFSLGAVLYTMLAGFEWTWSSDVGASVEADPEVAPELKAILLTAVDRDPDRRFPSMSVMRKAVAEYLEQIWPGRSWASSTSAE